MMRLTTIGLRIGPLALLAGLVGAPAAHAQDTCDAIVARAANEFDATRRVQLLMAGVDPTTCPPRGSWTVGVQLLAQTLIEERQDSLAAVWLRWAVRLAPGMAPDSVQFLPRVVQAFRSARDFVNRTSVRGDSGVGTSWIWPAGPVATREGRFQVALSAAPVRVDVPGLGTIAQGGSLALAPGSYRLTATASGFDSVAVTREVLPGVTTVLDVRVRPTLALQPPPAPPPVARQSAPKQKKKFPLLLVAGGVAAVGAAAFLLSGKKENGPTTGGITITFPNP
jgi:hypothetical protein